MIQNIHDERTADLFRKRGLRSLSKQVEIPPCAHPATRKSLEHDVVAWLSHYLPENFDRWTPVREEMAYAIHESVQYGEFQAIAADRGSGKTEIVQGVATKMVLSGVVDFVAIISANSTFSERTLGNIKHYLKHSSRLAEDYPEVCEPIAHLEGSAMRARTQTHQGRLTDMVWAGPQIVLPTICQETDESQETDSGIVYSPSSGSIIMTRGIDSALRGLNYHGKRPNLVIIDDPDLLNESDDQTDKKIETIENDIMGLADAEHPLSIVMLNNTPRRHSIGYMFTDPEQRPAWNGRRYPLVVQWPDERNNLWEQYVKIRRKEMAKGSRQSRTADKFYEKNKQLMDAGAEVTNPGRYNHRPSRDGEPTELSAIQHVFNKVADVGWDFVNREFQCDPPLDVEEGLESITEADVFRTQGDLVRGIVPDSCAVVTMAIDCGKYKMHWVQVAWQKDATSWIVDYGVEEVKGTAPRIDEGVEFAMQSTLAKLFKMANQPLRTSSGRQIGISRILIDRGYKKNAIYQAVKDSGDNRFSPCVGTHDYGAPAGIHLRIRTKPNPFTRPGVDSAQIFNRERHVRLWETWIMSNEWKHWLRSRILTTPGEPGSMQLFVESEESDTDHIDFACQLVDEEWNGKLKKFVSKSKNNHFNDALYYACVAASQCGVALMPSEKSHKTADEIEQESRRREHIRGRRQRRHANIDASRARM